jgi:hypothetical protein
MYSFDDNETIAFSKVKEFNEPLKNLIAIYINDSPIRREAYELKDFEIITIKEWILRNKNLNIQELFEKVIKDNLVIFSDLSVFKSTISHFYSLIHPERKQEVLDFLGYEELCDKELQEEYDKKQLQKDLERFEKLKWIKDKFQSIPPLTSSKITYERIRYLVKVSWSLKNTDEKDFEDVFESLRCTDMLVYVTGTDILGLKWSKFFLDPQKPDLYDKTKLTEKIVNMRKSLFKDYKRKVKEDESKNSMIYFIFAEGLNSFALLILKKSILLVETLVDSPIDVLKIIEDNSGLICDRNSKVILNISGYFNIYDVEILPEIFHDMIMREEFLSMHLVSDETTSPVYERKKMFYHFKLPLVNVQNISYYEEEYSYSFEKSVLFFISQEYMPSMMKVFDHEGNLVEIKTKNKDIVPYVKIHFFRALSEDFTIQFYHKLNRLFQYYNNKKSKYLSEFLEIFEDDEDAKRYLKNPIKVKVVEPKKKNLNILQQYAPELFVERYARKCQKPRQPTIIEKSQVDDFVERGYQVLGYPLIRKVGEFERSVISETKSETISKNEEPKWYFICESEKFKYPGLKENKLSNSSVYPFLPCCYETDQSPYIDSSTAILFGGSQKTEKREVYKTKIDLPFVSDKFLENIKRKHKIITDRVIEPGRLALLEVEKTKAEKKYYEPQTESQTETQPEIQFEKQPEIALELDIETIDKSSSTYKEPSIISLLFPKIKVFRFGVPISKNSILHAMCIALRNEDYFKSKNREDFISNLRVQISETINPETCKQELYDYTNEEIKEMLKNYEIFDTRYFYRAIEEFFNVNLFILTYYPSYMYDRDRITNYIITLTTSSATKLYSFEIPRHKLFYTRKIRKDRDTVVIFKHIGTSADSLKIPHCELIAHIDEKDSLKLIFSKNEKKILSNLYEIFILSLNVYRWNLIHGLTMHPVETISDEFLDALEPEIKYQIIDKIGKKRGYVLKDNLTILFSPLSPDNRSSGAKFNGKPKRVPFKQALEFIERYSKFLEIEGFSVKSTDKTIMRGIWLNRYYEGFFIPVIEEKIPDDYKKFPTFEDYPCTERKDNIFQTYELYKRVVTVFLQFCAHKIRAKEINKIKVTGADEEAINKFEEQIISLKSFIHKRVFRVSDIEQALRKSGILEDSTLIVPTKDIKNSIIYAYKLYDILIIRIRSTFTANVYKEEKYEELRSFWNIFPSDMKKHHMTRWFEIPNKDTKMNFLIDNSFEKRQYPNLYRVININLFREIERAFVKIENDFYIAFRCKDIDHKDEEYDKAVHIIICKYWRLRLKIIPYKLITKQIQNVNEVAKDIISEDGLIVYKILDSGEPYIGEEYQGNEGKKSLTILEIRSIQIQEKVKKMYFSLLPITQNVRAEIEPLKEKKAQKEQEKKEREKFEEKQKEVVLIPAFI